MINGWRTKSNFGEIKNFYVFEHIDPNYEEEKYIALPTTTSLIVIENIIKILRENKRVRIFYKDGTDIEPEFQGHFDRHDNGRFNININHDVYEGWLKLSYSSIDLRVKDDNCVLPFCSDIKAQSLLICSLKKSEKGRNLNSSEIIRIEYSNKKDGGLIWEHPNFTCYNRFEQEKEVA